MPIFLHHATFKVTSQCLVDPLATVTGPHGSLSQIHNVWLKPRYGKDQYDVLGTFPNLAGLDVELGWSYCSGNHTLERYLEITRRALLVDGYDKIAAEPTCCLYIYDIQSYDHPWVKDLVLNCTSSGCPPALNMYLHFILEDNKEAKLAVGPL